MTRANNLWPDDLVASDRVMPEDILRQQAEELASKTGGLLRAEVEAGSQGGWVTVSFYIVAPRLDDYAYHLFKVRHKFPNPFDPLDVIIGSKDIRHSKSRSEFEGILTGIFSSNVTRSLVGDLLALSKKAAVISVAD